MESVNKTTNDITNKVQQSVDKAKQVLDTDIVKNAKSDISSGVDKSIQLASYWKGVALGQNDLVSATDKSIALAEYWAGFGITLARELVHRNEGPEKSRKEVEELTEKLKQEMKTSNPESDNLVNDAMADINTGIQKSLDLAKNWTGVAMQTNDLQTAADRSIELANYWTGFGLNLTKQLVHKSLAKREKEPMSNGVSKQPSVVSVKD